MASRSIPRPPFTGRASGPAPSARVPWQMCSCVCVCLVVLALLRPGPSATAPAVVAPTATTSVAAAGPKLVPSSRDTTELAFLEQPLLLCNPRRSKVAAEQPLPRRSQRFLPLLAPATISSVSALATRGLALSTARAIVLLFHGCSHGMEVWLEGPPERTLISTLVDANLYGVAFSAASVGDPGSSKCWDTRTPLGRNPDALAAVRIAAALHAQTRGRVPLVALGVSSGGSFAAFLSTGLQLSALVPYISPLHGELMGLLRDGDPSGALDLSRAASGAPALLPEALRASRCPPLLIVQQPRDTRLAGQLGQQLLALRDIKGWRIGSGAMERLGYTLGAAAADADAATKDAHPLRRRGRRSGDDPLSHGKLTGRVDDAAAAANTGASVNVFGLLPRPLGPLTLLRELMRAGGGVALLSGEVPGGRSADEQPATAAAATTGLSAPLPPITVTASIALFLLMHAHGMLLASPISEGATGSVLGQGLATGVGGGIAYSISRSSAGTGALASSSTCALADALLFAPKGAVLLDQPPTADFSLHLAESPRTAAAEAVVDLFVSLLWPAPPPLASPCWATGQQRQHQHVQQLASTSFPAFLQHTFNVTMLYHAPRIGEGEGHSVEGTADATPCLSFVRYPPGESDREYGPGAAIPSHGAVREALDSLSRNTREVLAELYAEHEGSGQGAGVVASWILDHLPR